MACAVCLDQIKDPKTLTCHHSFCKECVEDLVKFIDDGSAVIMCPLGCSEINKLNSAETVDSSLCGSPIVKQLLAVLNHNKERYHLQQDLIGDIYNCVVCLIVVLFMLQLYNIQLLNRGCLWENRANGIAYIV